MKITGVVTKDIRFPTSRTLDGSDAMNADPDYSAAYVILQTDTTLEGHGLTFTIGRGNDICVKAIDALKPFVLGKNLSELTADMAQFWRDITGDSQYRWLGPDKGIMHLATGAMVNAVWDLWAKAEKKPLWKLLADMSPETLVGCVDFRYISDTITPDEALVLLTVLSEGKAEREAKLLQEGYPAYTTSVGWLGYSDEKIRRLCQEALSEGWTAFKMKVGRDLEQDKRRAGIIREEIGGANLLMMDANQIWDVPEAIRWMEELAQFDPHWIEEPTSPDDVLGHATIRAAIHPVKIATGEHCQNRVMFKQLMQANAIDFCQIDSCRVGGVNENLAILLMAAKYAIPVCPHAGGVGLCEYVQHLSMLDYVAISGSMEGRMIEFVDHLHEHFVDPVQMRRGRYLVPTLPGYSVEMKPESLRDYDYGSGKIWRDESNQE